MKTTTLHLTTEAAAALIGLIPSASKLMVTELATTDARPVGLGAAVVASFVGEKSADFAVVLTDADAMTVAGGPDSGRYPLSTCSDRHSRQLPPRSARGFSGKPPWTTPTRCSTMQTPSSSL